MSFGEFEKEVQVILEIILSAIPISLSAFQNLHKDQVEVKSDGSFVSICDFALQALIMRGIHDKFPNDFVLGEEDFSKCENEFIDKVKTLLPSDLDPIEACKDAIKTMKPENHRVWAIDPIDGTLGFVQQGHFGIATALTVDRVVKVSATAWPRHESKYTGLPFEGPAIFVAVEGYGAYAYDMNNNRYPVHKAQNPSPCILYSPSTGPKIPEHQQYIKNKLNIQDEIVMTSMVKGFILAAGKANVYCRFHYGSAEKIWDIAPFELFVREAGGYCTTLRGTPLKYLDDAFVEDSTEGLVFSAHTPEFHQQLCDLMIESIEHTIKNKAK